MAGERTSRVRLLVRAMETRAAEPWHGPRAVAAVLVLAATTLWRAVLLQGSYFYQDDFALVAKAYRQPLSWHFLVTAESGHVQPLQQWTYWMVAHHLALQWQSVASLILVAELLAGVLMWQLLGRLLPGRWVAVPLLAVFCLAPITLVPTLWWSAAMGLWPPLVSALLALLAILAVVERRRRWLAGAGAYAAVLLGLAWHEHAVLTIPLVFGVTCALVDARGWRRVVRALRIAWPLWLALTLTLVGYLYLHQQLTTVKGGVSSIGRALSVSWSYLAENALPGLLSGPWGLSIEGGAVDPQLWVTVAVLMLGTAVAVVLLRTGGATARWGLATFVAYAALDLAMLLLARSGYGAIIGLDPRYAADLVLPAVVGVAIACRGASFRVPARLGGAGSVLPPEARAAALVVAAYAVGAALTTAQLLPSFQHPEARTFVTNFVAQVQADPQAVVVDRQVPPQVVLPLFGRDSLLSRIVAPLPGAPAFDQSGPDLRTVDGRGRLQRVVLVPSVTGRPGSVAQCGYAVTSRPTRIPLVDVVRERAIVRVDYFTNDQNGTLEVSGGGWSTSFRVTPGPSTMWLVARRLPAPLTSLTLRLGGTDKHTVCVPHVEAGWTAHG